MKRSVEDLRAEADWLAAIGEPTRLTIIRTLAIGVKTVTELAKACKSEVVNVSHHLGVMRAAGLVKCDRDRPIHAIQLTRRIRDRNRTGTDAPQRHANDCSTGVIDSRK